LGLGARARVEQIGACRTNARHDGGPRLDPVADVLFDALKPTRDRRRDDIGLPNAGVALIGDALGDGTDAGDPHVGLHRPGREDQGQDRDDDDGGRAAQRPARPFDPSSF
jgi:hypothetical protein